MTLRVIFFGNSHSHFTQQHFRELWQSSCDLVGLVDSPESKRGSTNPLQNDSFGFRALAFQRGVPVFEPASPNSTGFVESMRELSPDLFIAIGYSNILKDIILAVPHLLAVNFHASLLPAYRGKHPVFWCLRNAERWSGLTVHVMDPGIDTGDILYQVRVRTRMDDTVATLYERIMERSIPLIPRLLEDVQNGTLRKTPQTQEGGSYFSSPGEEDFWINWCLTAKILQRWISVSPGKCFLDLFGLRIFFLDGEVVPLKQQSQPGEIVFIGRKKVVIGTGYNGICLRRVRISNGNSSSLTDFCHSFGLKIGDKLTGSGARPA